MSRVVLDTNVLVSFLTDREPEQQARAAALFEDAAAGEVEIVLHQMVITEAVYVLGNLYKVDALQIAQVLDDLLSLTGVRPVDDVVWTRVLELWPDQINDFADAVLAAVTLEGRHDAVATFDQKFAKALRRLGLEAYGGYAG